MAPMPNAPLDKKGAEVTGFGARCRRCFIERNVNLFTHARVRIGYSWMQGQKRGRCMYRPLIERTINSDGKLSSRIRHGLWATSKTSLPPPATHPPERPDFTRRASPLGAASDSWVG
jgi:hypothetical protein